MAVTKNFILSLLMMIAVGVHGMAQQTDCASLYQQVNEKGLQPSGGMRVLEYGVKVTGKFSGKENRVKIYSDSSHRYILTDIVQVYMDKDHSIMLAPAAKTIMINYTDAKGKKSLKESIHADFADSLFKSSADIIECKVISENSLYDRQMTIKPKNSKGGFIQATYFIKSAELNVYKIIITPKDNYDKVEYTFYQDSKNLSNEKISKPVIDLFFKSDGTLLPAYKGYRVTDNRNISSKN